PKQSTQTKPELGQRAPERYPCCSRQSHRDEAKVAASGPGLLAVGRPLSRPGLTAFPGPDFGRGFVAFGPAGDRVYRFLRWACHQRDYGGPRRRPLPLGAFVRLGPVGPDPGFVASLRRVWSPEARQHAGAMPSYAGEKVGR